MKEDDQTYYYCHKPESNETVTIDISMDVMRNWDRKPHAQRQLPQMNRN